MSDPLRPNPVLENQRPRPTGSLIAVLAPNGDPADAIRLIEKQTGTGVASTSLSSTALPRHMDNAPALFVEELNVAFIPRHIREHSKTLTQTLMADEMFVEVRPEFYLFKQQEFTDTNTSTWGVAATRALHSPYTGKGIKVCILDTGLDSDHPDFAARDIVLKSFVDDEDTDDLQGHGTHCAGTACGHPARADILRYGIAPSASLYVGKVLNNRGFGAELDILAGMSWAIQSGCEIISMSLGGTVREGEKPSALYERMGQRALDNGCLILAAAGNDSNRSFGFIAPVASPANAATIMAIGAVDPNFQPAYFSCGGINPNGGEIDLVAPGVGVFSSSPAPQLYRTMSGTSMACPHAAGIAALWAESDPALRGIKLWRALRQNARPLPYPVRDVGAGLIIAPMQTGDVKVV